MDDTCNMISFSGGKTSAMMTIELLKLPEYNENNTVVCFANTGKENEATLEFVKKVDEYLGGGKIIWIEYDNAYNETTDKYSHIHKIVDFNTASRNGEPFAKLIKCRKFVPNVVSRYCTQELKIKPIKKWMKSLGYTTWNNIVGIRYDEPRRYSNLINNNREIWENMAPLFQMKVTNEDVLKFWESMPFNLDLKPFEGNCDLCFLKGKAKKLRILQESPEKANWWIEQEKLTGATFLKDCSVEQLLNKANNQMQILYEDADYADCFCTID